MWPFAPLLAHASKLPFEPVPEAPDGARSVLQDADGYVWIAGDREVVRLGGPSVARWRAADPEVVARDAAGRTWVGGGSGVGWIDGDRVTPVPQIPGPVYNLPTGPGGSVWVTVQGRPVLGALDVEGGAPVLRAVPLPDDVSAHSILGTRDGRWWVGTTDGVRELVGDELRPVPETLGGKGFPLVATPYGWAAGTPDGVVAWSPAGVSRTLRGRYVTGLAAAPGGGLFVGTSEGALARWEGGDEALALGQGPPLSLFNLTVTPGGLFGATWGGGLVRWTDADGLRVFDHGGGLRSAVVEQLLLDREDTLWIVGPRGVQRLPTYGLEQFDERDLGAEEVDVLVADADGLWVGSSAGVVRRGADGRFVAWPGFDGRVSGLLLRPDGPWVTGPEHGAAVWAPGPDGRLAAVTEPWGVADPRYGHALYRDHQGEVWVEHRSAERIVHVDDGARTYALPGFVRGVGRRGDAETWFLVGDEAWRWRDGTFGPATWELPRSPADVDGLRSAGDGSMWATCTDPCGALRWGADGAVARLTEWSGLPSDDVTWIAAAPDGAWIGTPLGAVRVVGAEVVEAVGPGEGLPTDVHSVAVGPDGALWLAGDGLARFVPRTGVTDSAPLGLELAVTVAGAPLPPSGAVPWERRAVTAAFGVRSFRDAGGVRYRWRLSEGPWSEPSGQGPIFVPELPAGVSRLQVEARAVDGRAETAEVELEVRPPIWRRQGFLAAVAVALALAAGPLVIWRLRGAEQRRDELERLIADRTADLAQANDRLQRASANKSRYLASLSHEIRTPLNAIIGYAQLLVDEARDEGRPDADLVRVETAGRHLLALINDVLDLSKIEAGHVELHLEEVDLAPLVDEVLVSLAPLVAKNGNTLVRADTPIGAVVRADAQRVRQILVNLVGNAAKFTKDGTVTVQIVDASGPWRVEVRDTGIGIEPAAAQRLFQPFVQASADTAKKYGGTGLGLVLARELARAMGGEVGFRSVPGQGSTFWVELPGALSFRTLSSAGGDPPRLRPPSDSRSR